MATGVDDRVSTDTVRLAAATEQAACGSAFLFADFDGCGPVARGDANDYGPQGFANGEHDALDGLIGAYLRKHGGQTVKVLGQSVLVEFPNPTSAVRAAIEIERAQFQSAGNDAAGSGPRIGVHPAGTGGLLEGFGRAVHVAAAITRHAQPGQILVSREIRDAISAEADLACESCRSVTLEGGSMPLEVFEVQASEVQGAEVAASLPARYEVLSRVGTGGMGIVYKVRDREINDIIALKVLKSSVAEDPAMQENLRREVSLARKVTHKNVCRIYEFNREGSMAYVSMEFIEGESLQSKLRKGPLPWNEALGIARQVCAGLREAHLQGIVHRDLKPANIMVDGSGTVKITDFGIARVFQGTGQMTGTLVGTPAYMAPEQVELKRIDQRTDVYALGLLLYEMVTATPAFHGDTPIAVAVKQLREFPKRPRALVATLPAHAEAVILKCLQKDPAKRFRSVDELALALNQAPPAKRAASAWRASVKEINRVAGILQREITSGAKAGYAFVARQNWRGAWSSVSSKRARPVLVGALGGLCVLTGALVLAPRLLSKKRSPIADATETATVRNAVLLGSGSSDTRMDSAAPGSVPPPLAPRPMNDYAVDLAYSKVATERIEKPATAARSAAAPKPAKSEAKAANPVAGGMARKAPVAVVPTAAPASAPAAAAPVNTPQIAAAAPAVPAKSASVDVAAASLAPSGAAAPAAAGSEVAADQPANGEPVDPATADSSQAAHYFSVGSFKDSMWADEAVAKLEQLGFPASSVHKKTLWIQSYEVRVGPYEKPDDLEAAGKQLRGFGFKPHPVK